MFFAVGDGAFGKNFVMTVPKPWYVSDSACQDKDGLAFTYLLETEVCGVKKHITEKAVLLNKSRELIYEIYGTPLTCAHPKLPSRLEAISSLPDILKSFKNMRICEGIEVKDFFVLQIGQVISNGGNNWRHQDCTLLSINRLRCNCCKKYNKFFQQKLSRIKNKKKIKRVSGITNPVDRIKLIAMQKKMKAQVRKNRSLQMRINNLKEELSNQQGLMSKVTDSDMEKVSANQRLVVEEIVSAAKREDSRGNRYSDEFIMLCMLMNIRSPSYYEFLRNNKIIPLPCRKTVRQYISLVNTKCGFDENFFKLLEKSFQLRDPFKRHGILILDEINLTK